MDNNESSVYEGLEEIESIEELKKSGECWEEVELFEALPDEEENSIEGGGSKNRKWEDKTVWTNYAVIKPEFLKSPVGYYSKDAKLITTAYSGPSLGFYVFLKPNVRRPVTIELLFDYRTTFNKVEKMQYHITFKQRTKN